MMRRRAFADRFGVELDHSARVVLDAREDGAKRIQIGDAEREMVETDVRAAVERRRRRRIGELPQGQQRRAVRHEERDRKSTRLNSSPSCAYRMTTHACKTQSLTYISEPIIYA